MNPIFAKLNFKAQPEIVVIHAPDEFLPVMADIAPLATLVTQPEQISDGSFAIAFVKTQHEVDSIAHQLATQLKGDAILWMTYPKGSSKKYKCDFNRDTGWTELGKLGFEPVRMVAIDENWSALRFRRVEYVKKMTRSETGALTEQGKQRVRQEQV